MHIINQDRDRRYRFEPTDLLITAPVIYNGICMGNNLMLGTRLLGTFDTPEEALREAQAITSHRGRIYRVRGYSRWRGGRP